MFYTISFLVLLLLFSVVFTEGLTELVRKASILDKPRDFIRKISFFDLLLSCGYCTSVWSAMLPASLVFLIAAPLLFYQKIALFVFFTVVIHRLSNYLHNFNDKHLDKYYQVSRQQFEHQLAKEYEKERLRNGGTSQ